MKYLENMVNNGGIIIIMTIVLVIAFTFKTICIFCYDEVINKIKSHNFIACKRIKNIIEEYNSDIKMNRHIERPEYYLKIKLDNWKCMGMNLDRINMYGNIAITLCLIIGAVMDLIILSDIENGGNIIKNVNKAAVYTFVPLIFLGAYRLFDEITASDYKKKIIFDEVLNYMVNPQEYVKFVNKESNERFISDEINTYSESINKSEIINDSESINSSEITNDIEASDKSKIINDSEPINSSRIINDSEPINSGEIIGDDCIIRKNELPKNGKNDKAKKSVKDKELVIDEVLDEFLA